MLDLTRPAVGIAYSRAAAQLVDEVSDLVDFVEYPYELLAFDEDAVTSAMGTSAVLHCASLSLASGDPPSTDLVDSIAACATRIESPWVGEHCSFVTVRASDPGDDAPGPNSPTYDIGFAVSPPMNRATVVHVSDAVERVTPLLGRPLLIENAPIYLDVPGTTMSQSTVFRDIVGRTGVGVLLDLAHLLITCDTFNLDPVEELYRFPLDHVTETHLSGVARDSGVLWDDHSSAPVAAEYDLLDRLLDAAPLVAITHEYNWAPCFPVDRARHEIEHSFELLAARC